MYIYMYVLYIAAQATGDRGQGWSSGCRQAFGDAKLLWGGWGCKWNTC